MTKDCLLSMKGFQFYPDEEDGAVETVTAARYYKKGKSHYLIYEEVFAEDEAAVKSILKLRPDSLELTRRGPFDTHLLFEENKKNLSNYTTPYGTLLVGMEAGKISLQEEEDSIRMQVDYALEVNYERMADCTLSVCVTPRGAVQPVG